MINRSQRMKTVLVYRRDLLPWSETFIKEQTLALRRWRGVLIGMRQLHQLSLDGLELRILRPENRTFANRLHWTLSRSLGMMPRSAIRHLRREHTSLLHVHFGVDALAAWPVAKALDVPMLVTLHGYDINTRREWWEAGHAGDAMRHYPARLLKLAKHPRISFVAVSDAIRHQALIFGIPDEKITVRYIGIDVKKFTPRGRPIVEREQQVLFVGRLVEKKGCEYLIRAFAKVQTLVPSARLVIIGDGPLRLSLEGLAQELHIHANFRGVLSHDEVLKEFEFARVFCLPSITATNGDAEGLPIVLLEAQASGVPVVTSARCGTEGINDGVTGNVFPERDVEELRARLADLLSDDRMALSMAGAGPPFITKKFDLVRCTEALEETYDMT